MTEREKLAWCKSARAVEVEEFFPPFSPRLEVDPKLFAKKMVEVGVNLVQLAAVNKHAIYPSKYHCHHPELGGRDLFGEIVMECKKHGLRVFAYMTACHQLPYESVVKPHHPDWAWRPAPQGKPVSQYHYDLLRKKCRNRKWPPATIEAEPPLAYHVSEGLHAPLCWNSPYREAFMGMVEEIATGYPIDGFFFDSWVPLYWAPFDICYCAKCQKDFESRYGFELPLRAENQSATETQAMEDWFSYYKNLSLEVKAETVALVRRLDEDLVICCHGEEPYGTRDHLMDHDAFFLEEYQPLAFRLQYLSHIVNQGRICIPFIGRNDHLQRMVTYGKEFFAEGMATVASGAVPLVANGQNYYFTDEEQARSLKDLFAVIEEMGTELQSARPYPFIAIPTPRQILTSPTQDIEHAQIADFARTAEGRMMEGLRVQLEGGFRIGLSCHLPVQAVPQEFLSDYDKLKNYRILYLPGTPALDENEGETVRRYVREGGCLLASGDCSLVGEDGSLLKDFALADLLGLNLRKAAPEEEAVLENAHWKNDAFSDIYLKLEAGKPFSYFRLRDPMPQELRGGFPFLTPQAGTQVLANLALGEGTVLAPGITLNRYGQGKVVYVCGGFEDRYLRQRSPLVRDLFKNLFFCLADGEPPLQVQAPDTVFALLSTYEKGVLLHLINYTGCIQEGPFPTLWPLDLPRIEWIPKIEDVRIRVNVGKDTGIEGVSTLPGSEPTGYDFKEGVVSLSLPELGDYCGIRLQFEHTQKS